VLCAYCYSPEPVTEYYLELLKKWEENKTNCNMVHAEPHKNKKKNEEDDVRVVTHRGEKIGENFKHGEGSGQNLDEKMRKELAPSKF
jgi:hypothetical protein